MKIVITIENFNPNKGYLEYYLARELTELGHKVYMFTFGWSKNILRTRLKEDYEVISLPQIAVVNGYHIPGFSGLKNIIKRLKIGVNFNDSTNERFDCETGTKLNAATSKSVADRFPVENIEIK